MELENMFYIPEKDWYKLQAWATIAYDKDKNEISGLMTAVPQKDGRFKLSDVEILKQENTGSNTELDGQAVTDYTMKQAMKYKNTDMKFVWWHSHHTMGAFWSGTDIKEIEAWENDSYSLALVVNLKEEYVFRVSVWKANGIPINKHYDTNLTIERNKPKINITDKMLKEYKDKCENKPILRNCIHTFQGQLAYKKQNTLFQKENDLVMENYYKQAEKKLEHCMDGLVDGSMSFADYKRNIKEINEICKNNKLPFKVKHIKGSRQTVMNQLMTVFPGDMFKWEDEALRDKIAYSGWNESFGGGWYGN